MTDVLIRNIPEQTLKRIDEIAHKQRLSRSEFLRREIGHIAADAGSATGIDWDRFSKAHQDLGNTKIMEQAWQ